MTQHPGHHGPRPLRLGFSRGIAPGKWARRWAAVSPDHPLELVPLDLTSGSGDAGRDAGVDVLLERAAPEERPEGTEEPDRTRHALRLYTEGVALVVPADHELAESGVDVADLALVTLLDHPDHARAWPDPEPWADPAWRPVDVSAALELVATGAGAILLPLPLARHLVGKRDHAVLPVTGAPELPGSTVWATWETSRDAADVQQLVGVLRGRTARSSRPDAGSGSGSRPDAGSGSAEPARDDRTRRGTPAPDRKPRQAGDGKQHRNGAPAGKASPKPNSRGAQLAAAREKAERRAAARRKGRGRGR